MIKNFMGGTETREGLVLMAIDADTEAEAERLSPADSIVLATCVPDCFCCCMYANCSLSIGKHFKRYLVVSLLFGRLFRLVAIAPAAN